VQVDSTKLVHAGLLCVKSLSALRLYASRSTGTEAGQLYDYQNPLEAVIEAGLREDFGVQGQAMVDHWLRLDPTAGIFEKLNSRGRNVLLLVQG
jgi:hypothetical protein